MPSHAEVEGTQPVSRQAVTAALKHNGFWPVPVHDGLDHRLEYALVRFIGDAIPKREIHGVVFSISDTDVAKLSSPREVFAIFMEGRGHNAVGRIEGFFDTVTMVDVDVDVEDTLLETEKLDDAKYNV